MKFKVFTGNEPGKTTFLRLREGNGSIYMDACNEFGEKLLQGNILKIDSDGIVLCEHVSPKIGLPLDDEGRVIVRNGGEE